MALNNQNTNSSTPPMTQAPRGIPWPPPTRRPLPPAPPPRFLLPKMPFRLSCSLRRASSRSGGPCLPPRLSPPPRLPLPQGSWLFELLPPPGSFHAIAFSVVQNHETASADVDGRRSHFRNPTANADRCANRNRYPLLQSVLFEKSFQLPTFTLEQAV